MKTIARISVSSLLIMALAACGSGGKTTKPEVPVTPPTPPVVKPTPQKYPIKVFVSGLKGAVSLLNGTESLELKADGNASFSQSIEEGASYDVSIVKQPADQICSLKNGRKIMVANPAVVEVSCSDGFATSLQIIKPKDYSLKDLKAVSNYQSLGGQFDLPLTLSSKLKVYPNSFVGLRATFGGVEKTVYLAYVADKAKTVLDINSESTALALMLLEPAVVNALESHQLSASALFSKLAPTDDKGIKKLLPEMQKLADEILRQANAGGAGLFEFGNSVLIELLDQALALSLEKISLANPLAVIDPTVLPTGGTVITRAEKADKSGIAVTVNNKLARNLAVRWSDSEKEYFLLGQGESKVLEHPVDLTQKYTVQLQLIGAGKIGPLPEDPTVYTNNFARSVQKDYFAPSLASYLGLTNPSGQAIVDCLATATKKSIEDAIVENFPQLQPSLQAGAYYQAYSAAAILARDKLPTVDYLADIFKCANLGVGSLTNDEKINAQSHIRMLLEGWSKLRSIERVKASADLFNNDQQSNLVNAISKTSALTEWQYSNAFDLSAIAPDQMVEDEEYEFTASCGSEVVCKSIVWKFEGSHELTGKTVKYAFSKFGNQNFSVSATDSNGYRVDQDFQKIVARSGSLVSVRTKTTNTPLDETTAIDMGNVFSGSTLPYSFAISNAGVKPLIVNKIMVTGEGFNVKPFTVSEIAPGKTEIYTIEFSPSAIKSYSAKISVQTNEKYNPESSFNLKGAGVLPVGNGMFETTKDGMVTTQEVKYDVAAPVTENSPYVQLRMLSSEATPFPQLSLKISHYAGLGRYSLDDDEEQNCHGMLLNSANAADRFCTDTSSIDPTKKITGSVIVDTVESDPLALRLEYDFQANNSCLFGAPPSCVVKTIRVRGAVTVAKSVVEK